MVIADDSHDAADSLAMLLTMHGHDVWTAHDGHGALEAIETRRPQVALLDIGMAGLDGHEVARRTRGSAWGARTMLVAVSGRGQPEDKARAGAAGFDHHLTKPTELPKLLALLEGAPADG